MSKYLNSKIMLVEDSEVGRVLILRVLEELGYDNITAPETSVEAWNQIAQTTLDGNPFDLIITDLNMPDLDGMDLILNIKQDELSQNLKVIVVSAEADPKIVEILQDLGVLGYFSKPIKVDHFKITLKSILEGRDVEHVHAYNLP